MNTFYNLRTRKAEPIQEKEMAFEAPFIVPEMETDETDFQNIEIQVLKVEIHCDGCKRKVKKILRKIEGVYEVDIDKEQKKVTVVGPAEIDTMIKKLNRSGKHAEVWPSSTDQNHISSNDQFSSWEGLKDIHMMDPNLGLETDEEHAYSGIGISEVMADNAQMYNADILRHMMPMSRENGMSSFKHPSLAMEMNNMQGQNYNQTLPMMMMNMNNQMMPQYMWGMNNMNQVVPLYMQETMNMNSHVMPRDVQSNQFLMMNHASPFLDYYTTPYPYRYNYNNFLQFPYSGNM